MHLRRPNLKKSDLITITDLDGRTRHYIITEMRYPRYTVTYEVLADPEEEDEIREP